MSCKTASSSGIIADCAIIRKLPVVKKQWIIQTVRDRLDTIKEKLNGYANPLLSSDDLEGIEYETGSFKLCISDVDHVYKVRIYFVDASGNQAMITSLETLAHHLQTYDQYTLTMGTCTDGIRFCGLGQGDTLHLLFIPVRCVVNRSMSGSDNGGGGNGNGGGGTRTKYEKRSLKDLISLARTRRIPCSNVRKADLIEKLRKQ